jgi:Ser/Thr protein kinase RdoA (MazF antagonist)
MPTVGLGSAEVRSALRIRWQLSPGACEPVGAGLWRVSVGESTFAARHLPPAGRDRFEAGLRAAEHVESAGVAAGVPVRAADGALTVPAAGGFLALLRWVPGRALRRDDPIDQQWWGDTLATVHRALARFAHPGLPQFSGVRVEPAHLSCPQLPDWVRPAFRAATEAFRRLRVTDQLTYGVLHGDPSPDDFRLDPETGKVGLVQWRSTATGPLVYDVAAAVLFAGGEEVSAELVDGYLAAGAVAPGVAVSREECEAAMPTMLRLRAAVLAERIARRLCAGTASDGDRDALAGTRVFLG